MHSLEPWKRRTQKPPPVHTIPEGKYAVYIIWTRAEIRSAYTLSLIGSVPTDGMLECYVGKGQGKRPFSHVFEETLENTKNTHKIRVIERERKDGREPLITIACIVDDEEMAFKMERFFELLIGRVDLGTGPLTNKKQCGGVSGLYGPETRARMSQAQRALAQDPTVRERLNNNLARTREPESIAKMTVSKQAWAQTEEGREKLQRARAASHTEEGRAKSSEAAKKRSETEEGKAHLARARQLSNEPEARAKLSQWRKDFAQTEKGKELDRLRVEKIRKISPEQAEIIRQRHANGETFKAIAPDFNVTRCTISHVVNRKHGY